MYTFNAWTSHAEDPIGAAIRSDVTSARHVSDAALNYQSAVSRGNSAEIESAKQAFRQAWESDIRRKDGRPEDFIPNYPGVDLIPTLAPPSGFFFGQQNSNLSLMSLMTTMAMLYILWMFLG